MKSARTKTLGRVVMLLMCIAGLSAPTAGCASKKCGCDQTAKKCPPGCTKPCCKDA